MHILNALYIYTHEFVAICWAGSEVHSSGCKCKLEVFTSLRRQQNCEHNKLDVLLSCSNLSETSVPSWNRAMDCNGISPFQDVNHLHSTQTGRIDPMPSNANKLGGMDKFKNWDKSWTETFFGWTVITTVSPCPTSTAFQLRPLSSDDAWLPGPSEALRSVASDPNAQGNWLWGLDGRMSQETFRCEIALF